MKNNNLSSTVSSQQWANSVNSSFRSASWLIVFCCFVALYLVVANVLGKIGIGQFAQFAMVLGIPVVTFLVAAIAAPISAYKGFSQFQKVGAILGPIQNGLASASEWMSVLFIVLLLTAFLSDSHDALAIVMGIFLGFALMALLVVPRLPKHASASLAITIVRAIKSKPKENKWFSKFSRMVLAGIVILSILPLLIAQIEIGGEILLLQFPVSRYWAGVFLTAPIMVAILVGGMRALSFANILLFFVIFAALLLPAIWLSYDISSSIIPQLAYGDGALQLILGLEEQLIEEAKSRPQSSAAFANFKQINNFPEFLITMLCASAATAAMPNLYTRMTTTSGASNQSRSMAWILVLVGLVISLIPALATFLQFEIYRNFVGLPLSQLGDGVAWLTKWNNIGVGSLGQQVIICGAPAIDYQTIINACGGDFNYALLPSDINVSPFALVFGVTEITEMPPVFAAFIYTGVLSAAATGIGIAMMVIVNTLTSMFMSSADEYSDDNSGSFAPAPITQNLFASRVIMLFLAAAAIWVCGKYALPSSDMALWTFALVAGAVFPVLILALWWNAFTPLGAALGAITGFLLVVYILINCAIGPDWIVASGDEKMWKLPFSNISIGPLNAAVIGIPLAAIVGILTSLAQKILRPKIQMNEVV